MPLCSTSCKLSSSFALSVLFGTLILSAETSASNSGGTLIGGSFSHIGNPRLALLEALSGRWHGEKVAVDAVRCTLAFHQMFYLAGDFSQVSGKSRHGIARLSQDGKIDENWNPHVNGKILCLSGNGEHLFIGGIFESVDGEPRKNLACLDVNQGRVEPWTADTDGPVLALNTYKESLIVGGSFVNIGDKPRARLARVGINDGKVDDKFLAHTDSDVRAIALSPNLKNMYIGGQFSRIGAEDRRGLAKLDIMSGAVEPEWRADVEGAVFSLAVTNERIYVGGSFTTVGAQNRINAACINTASGAVDPWLANTDEQVSALQILPTSQIVLGGRFTNVNNSPAAGIVSLTLDDGTVTPGWNTTTSAPDTNALSLNGTTLLAASCPIEGAPRLALATTSTSGELSATSLLVEGSEPRILTAIRTGEFAIIGGEFSQIDGQAHLRLARINLRTGTIDSQWSCPANGCVRSMIQVGDTIVVGGDFTQLGNQPRAYLGSFRISDGSVLPWSAECDSAVEALWPITLPGDSQPSAVLVGGIFTQINSLPRRGLGLVHIANGQLDLNFQSNLTSTPGPAEVRAFAQLPNGNILVGGRFSEHNGSSAGNLSVINPITGEKKSWSGTTNNSVFALKVLGDRVALGGSFTAINNKPAAHLGMMSTTDGARLSWIANSNGDVHALEKVGDELWIGGEFNSINGESAKNLARFHLGDGRNIAISSTNGRVSLLLAQ